MGRVKSMENDKIFIPTLTFSNLLLCIYYIFSRIFLILCLNYILNISLNYIRAGPDLGLTRQTQPTVFACHTIN